MYSGFKLTLDESDFTQMKRDTSDNSIFLADRTEIIIQEKQIKRVLDDLLLGNGDLDATKMWEQWFPEISSHVFISHSHKDEHNVKIFAKWLYEKFSITSFIDSTVWGYADNLLKQIDDKFCLNAGGEHYSYDKRNVSTAHVHMVLTSALTMMLDNTECVIFLNTPNSINPKDNISGDTTYSPWIFNELLASKLLRRKSPDRFIATLDSVSASMEHLEEALKVQYPVHLEHLTDLSNPDLQNWEWRAINQDPDDNLDLLYKIKGVKP
jgi:hypothetical protein